MSEPLGEAHVDERTGLSYYGTRSQEEIRPRGFVDRPAVSVRGYIFDMVTNGNYIVSRRFTRSNCT